MNAELLTVGAEVLAGDVLDTNGRDLAQALAGLGVVVSRRVSVGDEVEAIAEAVRAALDRAEVVLVTGGLGPTPDDRTRDGVARAVGAELRLRPDLLETLRARFRAFGITEMPASNLVQVMLPEGSDPIPNPLGTAPGFRLERGRGVLFALPGIPREMARMVEDSVLPWLRANRPISAIAVRVLKTIGIGESSLVERHGALLAALEGVEVGYYPQLPGVNLKLSARASSPDQAQGLVAEAERRLREALGTWIYGADADTLPGVVGQHLIARGWTVATAESCTGGELAGAITSVPGASRYFDRGVVAYSNRAKEELLGVPAGVIETHGAVSEETARAMAEGLRTRAHVDIAISTTGIAGPSGGTPEKPVGLVWSAIAWPEGVRAWKSMHPGNREIVIARAVATDLNRLRLLLFAATDNETTMSPIDYPAKPRPRDPGGRRSPGSEGTLRAFVAVFPPDAVLARLRALHTRLDLVLPGVRWVGEHNLHFTLRFFGDLSREEARRAAGALDAGVLGKARFTVELSGIGVFPDWRRPRVLWVGTGEGSTPLMDLAGELERRFREAGLGKADKPFVPHLTVGRWREPAPGLDPDRARAAAIAAGSLGSFPVADVRLVQSVLDPRGSVYTPFHVAELGDA